jgi:excisionase family DNA binding protein
MYTFALSIKDVCKALNVTHPTVYKEIAAGRLKSFKIRNRRFSTPEACREYIAAREKEAE